MTERIPISINGKTFESRETSITIGRGGDADVHFADHRVSRNHAVLELTDAGWVLRDLGSSNGTFHDGERVSELAISEAVTLRLGDGEEGAVLELAPRPPSAKEEGAARPAESDAAAKAPGAALSGARPAVRAGPGAVKIGRGSANDLVIPDDLRVSRYHAELRRSPDGSAELVDLGSANGTFVDGARVKRAQLEEGALVGIGNQAFSFVDGRLEPFVEEESFDASALTVVLEDGRTILEDVSLYLEPSSLLAVVGPSGAGKSTLLNALTGFRPADAGSVRFGGRDLYAAYEELRFRMGFVPQEDILHPQLTVRRALDFAAELRFPPDAGADDRGRRIDEVLGELGLGERAGVRISSLSGGQRKRVSVALELLTKPSFLFLDEPTSGLDPGNERELMEALRALARGGRIVTVVTHSVQSLDLCDRVLFLSPGGKTAYFGPPEEALDYFERQVPEKSYAELFTLLDRARNVDWKSQFESDPRFERYIGRPERREAADKKRRRHAALPPRATQPWLRQLRVLTQRNLAVMLADRKTVLLLSLQAPLLGFLYYLLFNRNVLETSSGYQATLFVWLLAIGATWLGTSNAIREIVKELPIYRRERSVGLSIGPYLCSKGLVLGAITIVQAILLVAVSLAGQRMPPEDSAGLEERLPTFFSGLADRLSGGSVVPSVTVELVLGIALAGIAALGLGLLVSALVKTSDQSLAILPILLAAQIVLSLPLADLDSGTIKALGNVSSAQWGTATAGSSVDLNELRFTYELETRLGALERRIVVGGYGPYPPIQPRYGADGKPVDLVDEIAANPDAAFAQIFVDSQIEWDRRVLREKAREEGEGRWEHDGGAWGTNVLVLIAMAAATLAGAWLTLRRRDVRVLPSGSLPPRAEKVKTEAA